MTRSSLSHKLYNDPKVFLHNCFAPLIYCRAVCSKKCCPTVIVSFSLTHIDSLSQSDWPSASRGEILPSQWALKTSMKFLLSTKTARLRFNISVYVPVIRSLMYMFASVCSNANHYWLCFQVSPWTPGDGFLRWLTGHVITYTTVAQSISNFINTSSLWLNYHISVITLDRKDDSWTHQLDRFVSSTCFREAHSTSDCVLNIPILLCSLTQAWSYSILEEDVVPDLAASACFDIKLEFHKTSHEHL